MPQNSNFRLPCAHWFQPKFDFTVMAPNHRGDPLMSILGPMGSHWVKKMGQNHKKLPCPKIRIFNYPAVIDFGQNLTLRLWRQITEGTPKCVHLGANGSHLVQKMGQNRKKLPCPKRRIFDYPAVIDFGQNLTLRLWRQITVGTPYGPSWGQWGPIGSKKWVKTVKNYHAPEFKFSTTQRSLILAKIRLDGYGAKSRWGHPGVHLGANGVPLGQKNGSKP